MIPTEAIRQCEDMLFLEDMNGVQYAIHVVKQNTGDAASEGFGLCLLEYFMYGQELPQTSSTFECEIDTAETGEHIIRCVRLVPVRLMADSSVDALAREVEFTFFRELLANGRDDAEFQVWHDRLQSFRFMPMPQWELDEVQQFVGGQLEHLYSTTVDEAASSSIQRVTQLSLDGDLHSTSDVTPVTLPVTTGGQVGRLGQLDTARLQYQRARAAEELCSIASSSIAHSVTVTNRDEVQAFIDIFTNIRLDDAGKTLEAKAEECVQNGSISAELLKAAIGQNPTRFSKMAYNWGLSSLSKYYMSLPERSELPITSPSDLTYLKEYVSSNGGALWTEEQESYFLANRMVPYDVLESIGFIALLRETSEDLSGLEVSG